MSVALPFGRPALPRLAAALASPAIIVFVASNVVNVGNLAFNMAFGRLMGPELFGLLALLLTTKLAVLGVLGAVQTSVSQAVAGGNQAVLRVLARINRALMVGLGGLVAVGGGAVLLASPDTATPPLILLAALPFGASLGLLRGIAYGDMKAGRIALSANVEMAVRLVGGLLAWQAGLGITGVVAALALSIVAGWIVLTPLMPVADRTAPLAPATATLVLGSLPFGLLQLAQVLALDGDIFMARALLSPEEAGHLAALSLFQRIQFFACFSLAGILLPAVVLAAREGRSLVAAALPVAGLFAAVSAVTILAATVAPGAMILALFGPEYLAAGSSLLLAVLAAVTFTFGFLGATFLAALKDWFGIGLVLAVAIGQIALIGLSGSETMHDLLQTKLACQAAASVLMLALLSRRIGLHRPRRTLPKTL